MRILFIGNSNSFLLINLAKRLKQLDSSIEIDILSEAEVPSALSLTIFNKIYYITEDSKWRKRRLFKFFWLSLKYKKLIKSVPSDYDAVHILYLSSIYRTFWSAIKTKAPKRIITIFGSEFYRANKQIRSLQRKMVSEADIISATNPLTLRDFSSEFKVPTVKQRLCRFGLSVLDEIDLVTEEEIRSFKEGQDVVKYERIIVCGYNASPNQNLEFIIEALNRKKDILQNSVLFFQLPGAERSEYCQAIIRRLKQTGFPYRVFSKYFTDHELAVYRKSADIMIQVQNHDQFSGAMTEHIYAGNKVITGSWLPYEVMDKAGIEYYKVDEIAGIADKLLGVFTSSVDKEHNKKIIRSLCGWDENIEGWKSLYGN